MEAELEEQSRDNKALQLAMDKQELRLQASNTEMMKERQKVSTLNAYLHVYTFAYTYIRTYVFMYYW